MAWTEQFPGAGAVGERAERALQTPIGMVSPLWMMFGAAAGAGIAYWWMTSWTRAVNVEAFAGLAPKFAFASPVRVVAETEVAAVEVVEAAAEATLAVTEAVAEAAPVAVAAEPEPAPAVEAEPELMLEPIAVVEPVVEAAVEPALEAVVEAAPVAEPAADDLTVMVGVGPKLAAALAERGVTRFAQIAAWADSDLAEIDVALSLKGRAVREAWVAQARRLAGEA